MQTRIPIAMSIAMLSIQSACTQIPVGDSLTQAQATDGNYISWREHIIDDSTIAGFALSGSDGFVMGDIDKDGFTDIVSVHESDTRYDGQPDGHVRIAFGSGDPDSWFNITLAEGTDAAAPEDATLADVNGDGYLDVMVASELAHLIYLQNPGKTARSATWPRLILPMTKNRGSYIRVFFADFNGDGIQEVTAPNKGAQNPAAEDYGKKTPVSIFQLSGDPLLGESWKETVLGKYSVPQNSEPVDLDGDGDLDILVGSRGERRLIFFENVSVGDIQFTEHPIQIDTAQAAGFNLDYADFNDDGRLDIVANTSIGLCWLEQPPHILDVWIAHKIGTFNPDSMTGFTVADINGDGAPDIIAGSYSRGPRDSDGNVTKNDALGRIGWFENPGQASNEWIRHDISRRKRGMFDKFMSIDLDGDGDIDFIGTRGNSAPYDGVFWLEQVRSKIPLPAFERARSEDSPEMQLPTIAY